MKRLAVTLMLGAVCIQPVAARAADWPTRPIRIIAPSTPGGAADMFARLLCEQFSEALHERCFVENRAGAGGLIGTAATAQAAPDGYTLTTSSTAYHVIAPVVNPNPGFDPLKDFTHIAYVGGPPNVFVVNPALGVRSLADLVALGRRCQAIDYVSPGSGTLGQLLAESFAQKAGIKLQPIMTKGASQGMMDLVSGNVNLGTMTWTSALGQIRSGKVVPIVVSSRARLAEFPDLPTFKDLPDQFDTILIENGNGPGPFGSKGIGEGGLLPVASAIANAVSRAVGVRIQDLPLTPPKIWRALQTKAQNNL